jgi:SAM-dependent methyltransferase
MDAYQYALKVFRLHMQRAFDTETVAGKTILEIGPGDSVASAIIGRAYGASQIILVDAGHYASESMGFYRELADLMRSHGLAAPQLSFARGLSDVLSCCHAKYFAAGVESFRGIETRSVDYIWSHSVLEHVPKVDVQRLLQECKRVLRANGVMSHNIDFQDHINHSLNSLRFSEAVWESPLMRNSGFYTNRIRAGEMHDMVRSAGFTILQEGFGQWPTLPLSRDKLDASFKNLTDEDLLIRTSHFLARA